MEYITNVVTPDTAIMAGLSLLVVAALIISLKLANFFFRKVIDRRIIDNCDKWFKGVRLRNVDILTSAQLTSAALFITKIARWSAYALLFYTALPILFSIFPATRHLTGTLFLWIVNPLVSIGEGFVAYLPKLLRIIIIIFVMRYVLKFMRYVALEIEAERLVIPKFYPDWAHATYNLLRIFVCAFTLVLIFPLLPESESSVFKGVSVFIGVLFSIGSSGLISNLMAGLLITYMRSFKVGDRIKVGEVFGDVVEKTLFVVRVKTVQMEIVTIPNSTILSSNVINHSTAASEQGIILYQDIDVGYDITWERASALLIEAVSKVEHILADPPPFVLVKTLGSSAAQYRINVYTKRTDLEAKIYSDMNRYILDVFLREGIDMIVPQYEVAKSID